MEAARDELEFIQSKLDCCLVIDGESLQLCTDHFQTEFIELATKLSAVVACRCSPTQKADIARLIRHHTRKRVCCIGDGGNDVSMIQAADVGVGIVGKEGKQASLAADFSITQFSFLTKLLVWHGRNSYKRSAKLAQFVIHRGLIISIIQAVFSRCVPCAGRSSVRCADGLALRSTLQRLLLCTDCYISGMAACWVLDHLYVSPRLQVRVLSSVIRRQPADIV